MGMSPAERSAKAEQEFRQHIISAGAIPLYTIWKGVAFGYLIKCANGHENYSHPDTVKRGGAICKICSGRDSTTAERQFRERLDIIGATPLYKKWENTNHPHHVRCINGHDCYPYPNAVRRGIGICRACIGKDPISAEQKFIERLHALGAVPLYDKWKGTTNPHHVKCKNGHDCYPYPGGIRRGDGVCGICAGDWNIFYIVQSDAGNIKFGITSIDYRPRLHTHKRAGYKKIVAIYEDLPEHVARQIELSCIRTLKSKTIEPIQGKEYFDSRALPIVMNTVKSALAMITQSDI